MLPDGSGLPVEPGLSDNVVSFSSFMLLLMVLSPGWSSMSVMLDTGPGSSLNQPRSWLSSLMDSLWFTRSGHMEGLGRLPRSLASSASVEVFQSRVLPMCRVSRLARLKLGEEVSNGLV